MLRILIGIARPLASRFAARKTFDRPSLRFSESICVPIRAVALFTQPGTFRPVKFAKAVEHRPLCPNERSGRGCSCILPRPNGSVTMPVARDGPGKGYLPG